LLLLLFHSKDTLLLDLHPNAKMILGTRNIAFMHGPEHKVNGCVVGWCRSSLKAGGGVHVLSHHLNMLANCVKMVMHALCSCAALKTYQTMPGACSASRVLLRADQA
jgi:hypothetical protein